MKFLYLMFIFPLFSYENFSKDIHSSRLDFLKGKGFSPKVIYDIGAYRGNWTREIKRIFPDAQFFLFEANEKHRSALAAVSSSYFIALLGNENKTEKFYSIGGTGDSIFLEQTKFYQGSHSEPQMLQMFTLAALVEENNLPLPDFIKMDVQGAEQLIIIGSPQIIQNAEAIVMETKILEYNKGAPFASEMIAFMETMGYVLNDIFECHYLSTGELSEVDLLFVKKESEIIRKGNLTE